MRLSSHSSRLAVTISLLASVYAAPSPRLVGRGLSFDYDNAKVRGVNLGGWFVLEPWITPSIFAEWSTNQIVKDEYTYSQTLGRAEASRRLSQHWNSWITEGDFQQIAKAGLNHVRIPIGYWAITALPGDPYVQGQLPVLDRAIGWARGAGLKVMLDLHGAPGSQNGFDNSGRAGSINWSKGDTVSQTVQAINGLARRYASQEDVVTSIQLLNEPRGNAVDLGIIKDFYYKGYDAIRYDPVLRDTVVVLHDAFEDFQSWNGFMAPQSHWYHVMLDTHRYQIFSQGDLNLNPTQHIQEACARGIRLRSADKWTVVGEWTGAQTDCAKWLNGLGKGARYDGTFPGFSKVGNCNGKYTGSAAALSGDDKYNIRRFIEAQLDAYEQRTGWFFWTWKTESAPEWNMQDLLRNGLFPQPLTSRQYPGQCGY